MISKQVAIIVLVFISLSTCSAAVYIRNPLQQEPIAPDTTNNVTSVVENIGDPFLKRYPGSEVAYVRNVWDMQVYGDRLYLGYGNSNNSGPGSNAGPIEAWYWDGRQFAYDLVLQEEQIDHFVVSDGLLMVPGNDPHGAAPAVVHIFDGTIWTENGPFAETAHVYDVIRHNGNLYAALGINGTSGDAIAVSSDNGRTWIRQVLPVIQRPPVFSNILRAWQFFEVGVELFVSVLPQYANVKIGNVWGYERLSSPVYHLNSQTMEFEELPIDFFAGQVADTVDGIAGRVVRPIRFNAVTVYIGAKTFTDDNWTPFGLFSVDEAHNVRVYPLASGDQPWDTLVFQNTLYVLTSEPLPDGSSVIHVMATCDLSHWREVLDFKAPTFARSFELYRGDFYFGLGTETSPNAPQAGAILRVNHTSFDLSCE